MTYSGYTNRATWAVCLWLDNDEGSYNYWQERARELARDDEGGEDDEEHPALQALAVELQQWHYDLLDEMCPGILTTVFGDLLTLSEVDWREVASTRLDD